MKFLFSLAILLALSCSTASATPVLYNISEAFTVSAYFTGTFYYDATTSALTQLQGSVDQGGTAISLLYDFNSAGAGIPPSLQADGFGGVTDTVCNGSGLAGYACVYLDIKAASPTVLNNVSHLGIPLNEYVNGDVPLSGPVASYSITLANNPIPEPSTTALLMSAALIGLGARTYRRRHAKQAHISP